MSICETYSSDDENDGLPSIPAVSVNETLPSTSHSLMDNSSDKQYTSQSQVQQTSPNVQPPSNIQHNPQSQSNTQSRLPQAQINPHPQPNLHPQTNLQPQLPQLNSNSRNLYYSNPYTHPHQVQLPAPSAPVSYYNYNNNITRPKISLINSDILTHSNSLDSSVSPHINQDKSIADINIELRNNNNNHVNGLRNSNTAKPYTCSFNGCKWSFARQSDLRRHSKSHSEPTYNCPYYKNDNTCHRNGGAFNRLDVLKRHLKLVHFVKDKQSQNEDFGWCRSCQRMFPNIKSFLNHCNNCAETCLPVEWKIHNYQATNPKKSIINNNMKHDIPIKSNENQSLTANENQSLSSNENQPLTTNENQSLSSASSNDNAYTIYPKSKDDSINENLINFDKLNEKNILEKFADSAFEQEFNKRDFTYSNIRTNNDEIDDEPSKKKLKLNKED